MIYDTIIVGSGTAGLSAAVYAGRAQLIFAVVDRIGGSIGQISGSSRVDNYLGLYGESGFDLGMKFRRHAQALGTEFIEGEVVKAVFDNGIYKILLKSGEPLQAKTVVYAAGTEPIKPDITGLERFSGKGVSYCAICDGAFYRNKVVAVIGGGDSALGDALFLAPIAAEVYVIHRRNELRANKTLCQRAEETKNIHFILGAEVKEFVGGEKISSIRYIQSCKEQSLDTSGVFIAVGSRPATEPLRELVELNEGGYIIAGEDCITSAKGIFAAGDVRTKPMKQLITAAADGANSVHSAEEFLRIRNSECGIRN